MDIVSFIEGPLVEAVLILFGVGILARIIFSFTVIIRSDRFKRFKWKHLLATMGRSLAPFHRALKKKPFYTLLRYIFHICLIVVPVFFYGHIVLWESSWLELSWQSIPDIVADWMTIIFILLSVFFLLRRVLVSHLRRSSSSGDYVLILIGILTFLSGYFLTHGTLDSIPFFLDNMQTLHIFFGEAMIITALLLFLRSRLDRDKCTGCAACESSCPTGTLESYEIGENRIFSYSHYQCICCGACIDACPEAAAELRHHIGIKPFFRVIQKEQIRTVKLQRCRQCGTLFAPEIQLKRISELITDDYVLLCPRCKMVNAADTYHQLIPWLKKLKT
ncbi:MAG: 4Fe-4S dicluster domain-containing protein [Candidatus Aminicenantes bacterium]|nr:4Fe-4S dicluster domain-containing protein [Candidatus Aminicenantes bacterium]